MKTNLPETAGAAELSDLLGIGSRHLRKLAEIGVVTRADGGRYHVAASVRGYLAHAGEAARRARGSTAATELQEARAEAIQRRMEREDRKLVESAEMAGCLRLVAALADESMAAILAAHDEEARVGLAPHIEEARVRIANARNQALQILIDGRPRG